MAGISWHSADSKDLVKEFHKVYKEIEGPIDLMLSYRPSLVEINAMMQVQSDLGILCELLIDHWCDDLVDGYFRNNITKSARPRVQALSPCAIDRTAFLFEMAEFSLAPKEFSPQNVLGELLSFGAIEKTEKRPKCGIPLKEHVAHYKQERGGQKQTHINGFTLELLKEYDATKNTNHCSAWKKYLEKVIDKAFFSAIDFPIPEGWYFTSGDKKTLSTFLTGLLPVEDQELRIRLIESYGQAATGGRSGGFSHALGQDMDGSIRKFIATANQGWRVLQNRDQKFKLQDSHFTFNSDAMALACMVIKLDEMPHEEAVKLLWDIAPSLGLYGYMSADLIEKVQQQVNNQGIFEELPDIVQMMDLVQDVTRGNEGRLARHTLFNLVVCFCKADGAVSKAEEKILKTFANTLFGKNESVTADLGLFTSSKSSAEIAKPKIISPEQEESKPLDTPKQESTEDLGKTTNPEIGGVVSADKSIAELNSLVGLERVKADVQQLTNVTRMQQVRRSRGMKVRPAAKHMLFYGNPGTGKTTVARLISQIYKDLGVVSKGHLIDTDRPGLVGGYSGHTALKVTEVVTKAVGGVLFIDEAYSLNLGDNDPFGQEAIDTLVKLMEDYRDDLVVIAAGYPAKMENFIGSNPGLRSRFNTFFSFDDYNPEQLLEIFIRMAKSADYEVAEEAAEFLGKLFEQMYKSRDEGFGNGRDVRNVLDAAMQVQATRLVNDPNVGADILSLITLEDVSKLTDASAFKSKAPSSFGFQATRK